jgi:GT2 family glycosyltransferase
LRAKQLGFETWYTPVGTVIHHWLTVSETTVRGIAWLLQSQLLFFRKHFAGWKGDFMVATKYFGILLRLIFYPVAAILTRDRRRMRQWTCLWSASRKVITSGISVKNSGKHELWHQLT